MKLEVVLKEKAIVGEGPSWDAENGLLNWVDILGQKVHSFHPASGRNDTLQFDQYVGTVVSRDCGGLVVALQDGIYAVDEHGQLMSRLAAPEAHLPRNRFNDGKCDPAGRLWAGTMSMDQSPRAGALYRLDPDLSIHRMLTEVTISNGLGWSPDGSVMYFIDTPTMKVVAYEYELLTGSLGKVVTEIVIPEPGAPDGMTVDEEGMLWIAHWGGSRVSRWNPYKGECLEEVQLPVQLCTSCVFGGPELNELYITTARGRQTELELKDQPHAGNLFRLQMNVKGQPSYKFKEINNHLGGNGNE
ncbi:SMP-30/gluconolactonase/LRE family protein [Paenibacillus roseipurpureus]|uniref:SMP-30/gluconolactonase/LRE family protein n=1 Tax=Paenibacillus roseopurpureus TaxID=2918901 RepID=UPI0037C9D768